MLRAHAAAYHTIHELQPLASVGIARHFRLFEPASSQSVLDRFAARNLDRVLFDRVNRALLTGRWGFPVGRGKIKGLARTMDFIGLNYHTRELVAFSPGEWGQGFAKRSFNPDGEMSDHNFGEIYPAGILKGIERAAAYSRPIFITENGLPDADDDQRPRFILAHLLQVWRALQENLPVMGYYHQSLVDSFEWDRGWTERFGLISVDTETQIRTWRQSGELYRQICQRGCIDWEMVHRWAPELLEYIFPG